MPNSPLTNTRIPDTTYAPDIADIVHKAVYDLEVNGTPRFTTTTARDTAYAAYTAAGGVLADGRTCYTDDAGYFERVNGGWQSFHGLIGHGVTTTQTTSASTTPVTFPTGMRFSCYLQTGRAYEYSAELRMTSTVANDSAAITTRVNTTGSPAVTDPSVAATAAGIPSAAGTGFYPLNMRRVFQVAAPGTYTFNIWAARSAGTGTVTFSITADGSMAHWVKDVGVALSTVPFPA